MSARGDVTTLLGELQTTEAGRRKTAYDLLFPLLYDQLRSRARQQLGREWGERTLQPTALVHEVYQHLIGYEMPYESREHFLNVAAGAMRRLVVDAARRRNAKKRWGGQECVTIDENLRLPGCATDPVTVLMLDEALAGLTHDQVRLVELRYFLGLSMEQTAAAMNVKAETLKKRWRVIKLLLYNRLRNSAREQDD